MDIYVSELSFLIDDEKRAFGNAIVFTISTEAAGYLAFGMKVAQ